MDIAVEIEGVTDRRIAGAIRTRVRALGRTATRSGDRQVVVVPSETRGELFLAPDAAAPALDIDGTPEQLERLVRDLRTARASRA